VPLDDVGNESSPKRLQRSVVADSTILARGPLSPVSIIVVHNIVIGPERLGRRLGVLYVYSIRRHRRRVIEEEEHPIINFESVFPVIANISVTIKISLCYCISVIVNASLLNISSP